MTLFSYVVRWDHGFAPNPFYAACTLATCKPHVRKKAKIGDWILGTGSAKRGFKGRAVFIMRVTETLIFDEYWADDRFSCKRPVMNGSLRQRFGDNIYHHDVDGTWQQADSRHSQDGANNLRNLNRDTKTTDRVLIGSEFTYWGKSAPIIPPEFADLLIQRPGWEEIEDELKISGFLEWTRSFNQSGWIDDPIEWSYERWWR